MNPDMKRLAARRDGNVNKENIDTWERGWEGTGKEFN